MEADDRLLPHAPRVTPVADQGRGAVGRYLLLGLGIGRHIDGFVDAYYGPPALAERVTLAPAASPERLVEDSRALLSALNAGVPLDADNDAEPVSASGSARRRRWLRAQTVGLWTTARRLAGEPIGYAEEVESCYGVRPRPVPDEEFAEAHRRLEEALPGSGPLPERLIAWRESHAV